MIVRCSQCGAAINRTDERRFFTCPFCRSSLVLEGGRSFACLVMEHNRHDAWVRALFSERLQSSGKSDGLKDGPVEFSYYPFWFIRTADGLSFARPAAHTPYPELSSVKVPPGRITYLDEANPPPGAIVPFTIPPEAVFGGEGERVGAVDKIDLIYLPIYSAGFSYGRASHTASIVGDSPRVYSTLAPTASKTASARPLIFFLVVFLVMVLAGYLCDETVSKAAAVGIVALIAAILSRVIIGSRGAGS